MRAMSNPQSGATEQIAQFIVDSRFGDLPANVVDAGLSGRLRVGPAAAVLAVRLENLLDARYALVRQYPMPPRHVRVRLTLSSL